MGIIRFFTLITFAIGAAQLACAAIIPASVFSGSPTDCLTAFSKPLGDAPAPTGIPQDGTVGPLGCPPSFSASGLPDAVRETLIEWTENLPPSQRPSGFPPVKSADESAPTNIPGDAFDKSLAPSNLKFHQWYTSVTH